MALLGINFEEVPDKIEPIATGTYDLDILEITEEDVKDKPGKRKLVVKHKIVGPEGTPEMGRETQNHISLEMKTTLKNLYHSATGQRPGAGGYDPVDLVGKVCKAHIERQIYKQNGVTKEAARITEYLIPA